MSCHQYLDWIIFTGDTNNGAWSREGQELHPSALDRATAYVDFRKEANGSATVLPWRPI
jgi:hypothetical protein